MASRLNMGFYEHVFILIEVAKLNILKIKAYISI